MTKVKLSGRSSVVIDGHHIPSLSQVLLSGNDGGALQIKNIADPTQNQDVVTLAYFNQHSSSGSIVSVSGTSNQIVANTVAGAVTLSLSGAVVFPGTWKIGTLGYSDTGILWSAQSSFNSYNQAILQNTNNGASASTNFNVSNDLGTATTNFGEFGINSSGFTGSSSFSIAGNVYLAAASTDLVIGTYSTNAIKFITNSSTTDRLVISSTGVFTFNVPISGSTYSSTWTASANNQSAFEYNGTITSRNTASDNFNYLVIDPTLARNAGNPATQTATAVLINPTFSNSPTTQYILRLQNAGSDKVLFQSGSGSFVFGSNGLQIQSSLGTPGGISLNGSTPTSNMFTVSSGFSIINTGGVGTATTVFSINPGSALNWTTGSGTAITINPVFNPTSGTGIFTALSITAGINQTGGANGAIIYLDINPARTAVIGTEYGILSRFGMNSFGLGATLPTALVHIAASTTAMASLCVAHGTAPNSPVNGDFWTTTAGAFIRINGVTKTFTLT